MRLQDAANEKDEHIKQLQGKVKYLKRDVARTQAEKHSGNSVTEPLSKHCLDRVSDKSRISDKRSRQEATLQEEINGLKTKLKATELDT